VEARQRVDRRQLADLGLHGVLSIAFAAPWQAASYLAIAGSSARARDRTCRRVAGARPVVISSSPPWSRRTAPSRRLGFYTVQPGHLLLLDQHQW
jgi:hypothetical protein